MDYVLDLITLDALEPGRLRDAAERLARAALEIGLGGSSDHVLLARLDCEVDGGAPASPLVETNKLSPAQFRWVGACSEAIAVVLRLQGIDDSDGEAWGEGFEHSSVHVTATAPPALADHHAWTQTYADRLVKLEFDFVNEPPEVWAERAWLSHSASHPIWAADEEFAVTMSALDIAPHPRGRHPAYYELREQLRHLMN